MKRGFRFCFWLWFIAFSACREKEPKPDWISNLKNEPYKFSIPAHFPAYKIPEDNPTTTVGVLLGRYLFYEKRLSLDSSISCASCHAPNLSFSDGLPKAKGIRNQPGKRNSMALVNLLWSNVFFWDGRAKSLEEQSLHPIQDPIEMNLTLAEAVNRLQKTSLYPALFSKAFGNPEITSDKIAKALAQFERTLISSDSKYDRFLAGTYTPTAIERQAIDLFFTHPDPSPASNKRGGNCGDCHLPITTAGLRNGFEGFFNTGLNANFSSQTDVGLQKVTSNSADRGRFKTPSLRNIALTAPYMHDGRIPTLDSVLNHYNAENLFNHPDVDILITSAKNERFGTSLGLTESEKSKIIVFLNMLTDTSFIRNPAFSNPNP